jgi:hypothetical protein
MCTIYNIVVNLEHHISTASLGSVCAYTILDPIHRIDKASFYSRSKSVIDISDEILNSLNCT